MSPEEKVTRASHAEQLMRDELLTEAFDKIETAYINAWKASRVGDKEAREFAYSMVSAVSLVRRQIIGVIQEGQLAVADIEYALSDNTEN